MVPWVPVSDRTKLMGKKNLQDIETWKKGRNDSQTSHIELVLYNTKLQDYPNIAGQ